MMITVLTPIYNRGKFLPNLYQSLLKQDDVDFEWVIIDDGSTDNTNSIVERFIQEKKILISYIKQPNGGKHRAVNKGVQKAQGELTLILDSDDTIPANSLSTVNKYYEELKGDPSFAGVCGLMAHHDGTIIGHGSTFEKIDTTSIEIRYKYDFKGDMCEVFKTEVLREFPFPEIEGEKFCPEALVWNRIATKYKLRFFNQVIYFRDYLDGGLTSKIIKIRMNSPIASMMCYTELNKLGIPFKDKAKAAINYWRFRFCLKGKKSIPTISIWWLWAACVGWGMHINDIRVNKKEL